MGNLSKSFFFLGVLGVVVFSLSAADFAERVVKVFSIGPQGSFSLVNLNGRVRVATHARPEIRVQAIKSSDFKKDLPLLKIVFLQLGDRVEINVKYPEENVHAWVDFFVWLPESFAETRIRADNGPLDIEGLFGKIVGECTNASLEFTGNCLEGEFRTINGKISIDIPSVLRGNIDAKAKNSSIDFAIHPSSSFYLEAIATNGKASGEFDLDIQHRADGSRMSGSHRGGKFKIDLRAFNGDIELTKS